MSVRYQLPCTCGRTLSVGDAQAGSQAACECGHRLAVPKLRELRRLPIDQAAAIQAAKEEPKQPWNGRQMVLFACGSFTLLVLAVSLVLVLGRSQIDLGWTPEEQKKVDDEFIDRLDHIDTLGAYYEMRASGLGEQKPTRPMQSLHSYQDLTVAINWAWITAGIGAAIWLAAAIGMPKPKD